MIAGCGAVEYIAEIRWSVSVQQSCQHGFIRNCNHEFLQQMQLLFRIFQRQDKNEMDINVLILLRAAALSKLDGRDQTACGNLSVYHVIRGQSMRDSYPTGIVGSPVAHCFSRAITSAG